MSNEDQLKITARALDYLLANTDLTAKEKESAERAACHIDNLITGDAIDSTWHIEDVQGLCNEMDGDEPVTPEEARQVLKMTEHYHDATIGINWDVLRVHLDMVREGEA